MSALLYDAPRSLYEQAVEPCEPGGPNRINVDGTGIAWWDGQDPRPLRYRTDRPPWADENLSGLASRITAGTQLAAVRSASTGIPYGIEFSHPFVHGDLAGTHNGVIGQFRAVLARPLLARLPDHLFSAFGGMSDSLAIFLLAVAQWERDPAGGLAGALRGALTAVGEECARAGSTAKLNVALAHASGVAVVKSGYGELGNSLYVLCDGARWPGASIVASEPLDSDSGWTLVPDRHIVTATRDGIDIAAC